MELVDDSLRPDSHGGRYRPLVQVALAVGGGAVAGRYAGELWSSWFVAIVWICLGVLSLALFLHQRRRGRHGIAAIALLAALWAAGGARMAIRWSIVEADDLARFARLEAEPACLRGTIVDPPQALPPPASSPLRGVPLGTMTEATVELTAIRDGKSWRSASGRCRLRVVGELVDAGAGDAVLLYARIARPGPPLNPGQFDWAERERIAGRLSEAYCRDPECVVVEEKAAAGSLGRWTQWLRRGAEQSLRTAVGEEQGDLAAAVLLGAREGLSDDVTETFLRTGTIDLLVVSGLHVGMLAAMIWGAVGLPGFRNRWRIASTVAVLTAYLLAVGPQAPVVRASVLVVAWLAALVSGRRTNAVNVLAAAALVILAFSPAEVFRPGTQLSFVCVAALAAVSGPLARRRILTPLEELIAEARPWWNRWGRSVTRNLAVAAAASTAVWIVTAPLVAAKFHIVTPSAILLTPLLMPLVSVAMGAGLAAMALGWLAAGLAVVPGFLCSVCLDAMARLVAWGDGWSWGHAYVGGPADWWLAGWFLLGLGVLLKGVNARVLKHAVAGGALWGACGFGASALAAASRGDALQCTFLAVGHGTCVVMEFPTGETILYDAGSLGSPESTGRLIACYLWERGISRIDAIVLSHADVDHYNAVPTLLEMMPIDKVYISPLMFDPVATGGRLQAPNFLRDELARRETPLEEIWLGDRLRTSDPRAEIEVLFPTREGVVGRDNANSILLGVEYDGTRILLPGDIESPGIDVVMADPPWDCDILLAPHHGSAQSDPPGFAAWCTPAWVIFSGGERERTLAVDQTYQEAGAACFHTASAGAIRFTVASEGVKVSPTLTPSH